MTVGATLLKTSRPIFEIIILIQFSEMKLFDIINFWKKISECICNRMQISFNLIYGFEVQPKSSFNFFLRFI
jgi:hypothetical protein